MSGGVPVKQIEFRGGTGSGAPPPVDAARRAFRERFGRIPEGVAFAPGRVNLIGEHVDYCALPVLPAALSHGVALAFAARRDERVRCLTTAPGFEETDFTIGVPLAPTGFGRYLAAAAAGLDTGHWTANSPAGFDGTIASDLPVAAGLSSSSAVVIAGALALLAVRGRLAPGETLPREDAIRLALDLAEAEHGVAIRGGAMDQSVCLGAVPGHALHIAFERPRWTPVPVDSSRFRFLAAYSGQQADKGGAAGATFDERVRQAQEALRLAREFLPHADSYPALVANHPLPALLAEAGRLPAPLAGRFRHVISEAGRTAAAAKHLEGRDATALGETLDASHESLRRDYGVSTRELDELVEAAREAGALGARLTGAGLGGSVVILAPPGRTDAIRAHLTERYYLPRGIAAPRGTHLLDATPSGPAALY
ncbi:MAG: hypothetical protein F4023_10200 [Acidobacteria bacterium]|nr:hypothetical protein [Acidobacteriota bacterium]MYK80011.1 hypothetical protein [Acidobacteriota bacterium]